MTKETAASLILGVVSPLPLFTSSVSPSRRPFGPEVKEWGKDIIGIKSRGILRLIKDPAVVSFHVHVSHLLTVSFHLHSPRAPSGVTRKEMENVGKEMERIRLTSDFMTL